MQDYTYLRRFNRKERFFLIGMALGNPSFTLSSEFRSILHKTFGLIVPEDAFCAMDYHIDWLFASLALSFDGDLDRIYSNIDKQITATQEDIDFLITYQEEEIYHLILLEAKGVTGWSNAQIRSKAQRMLSMFDKPRDKWLEKVKPHFAIVSPKKPQRLDGRSWPTWMRRDDQILWIELPIPTDLIRVSRCDDGGRSTEHGTCWRIVHESHTAIEK